MDSVRARISFGDNFSELATIHRRCLILVSRNECTTVNALKEYIRIKFSIDQQLDFGLSIDGYVLPEWESSQIIRENDTLCVFATDDSSVLPVLKNKLKKKKRKSEDGSNRQIEPEAKKAKKSKRKKTKEPEKENDKKKREHKHKTLSVLKKVNELEELSIKQQERSQGDVDSVQTFPANVNSTIATEQQLVAEDDVENVVTMNGADVDALRDEVEEKRTKIDIDESGRLQEGGKGVNHLKNGDASQSNSLLSLNERMVAGLHETINEKDEITPLKKKRRRKRRKKSNSNIAVKSSGSQEQRPVIPHESTEGKNVLEGLGVSSNQSIRETLIIDKEHSSGHIVFDSDDDDVENQSKKVEIQDESIKSDRVTDLLTSHLEQNGEVEIDNSYVQGHEMTPTVLGEEAQQEKQFHKKVPKNYEAYQPLNGPPRNGDIIAFKTLELSSLYTPEVSEFKEGVVTKFDHKTQQVDIQLTTVPFTKPAAGDDQRDGRFEMEMDEDWTTDRQQEQATALISTHLSSLIDLKLIS